VITGVSIQMALLVFMAIENAGGSPVVLRTKIADKMPALQGIRAD
jgi:hypothetical protein